MPAAKSKAKAKDVRVVAALVVADIEGASTQFRRGDVLPDGVSEESLEHLKALGFVEDVDSSESADVDSSDEK